MANYPTQNPSFTTKNTGNTIQASHINALQDEVIAIGTDLRGGLAHGLTVSTGGLTVSTGNTVLGQNLSVGGNSTMSGLHASSNLQVDGTSTFTGAVVFSAGVTFNGAILPTVPFCSLTHSTLQAVADATETGLSWDTATADASNMHSSAVNSSRITFAPSTGWYEVGLSIPWSAGSSGGYAVRIRKNDTQGLAQAVTAFTTAGTDDQSVVTLVRASDTTDYVTAVVFQASGSTRSVSNASTRTTLQFYAKFVSK